MAECETVFMDIVREAEVCQTNLAEYATYPYWPDVMGVVSNFCEKENCVVVDVGHHFGLWGQGCGKSAYVTRESIKSGSRFVPRRWPENGNGGFCVISRGGSYTNVACHDVGSVCCYDSDGRFVDLYDSVDKIPGMKRCFDDEQKANYGKQDRWMRMHGFAEERSGREAENRLDAARADVIDRLNSLRTILSTFPQWRSDNKWYRQAKRGKKNLYDVLSRIDRAAFERQVSASDDIRKRIEVIDEQGLSDEARYRLKCFRESVDEKCEELSNIQKDLAALEKSKSSE